MQEANQGMGEGGLTAGLARLAARSEAMPIGPEAIAAAKRAFIEQVGGAAHDQHRPARGILAPHR